MTLQSFVEVACADARVHDGHDDQGDGDDSEEGEGRAGRFIRIHAWRGIHSHELEEEVGEATVEEELVKGRKEIC